MTFPEFDEFQKHLMQQVEEMRTTKGKEYANSEDRFANFKRLASELGMSPEQVLWVYLTKHLDAIRSYIRTQQTHSTEPIQGRIVDAITYLTLLAGIIFEREQQNGQQQRDKPLHSRREVLDLPKSSWDEEARPDVPRCDG